MASGTQNLTSDKARVLSTQPGTDKFWRGDNSWSNEILGGLLKITNNSNTLTIGSANTEWCHLSNSGNIPFYFNRAVHVDGDVYRYNTTVHMSSSGFHPPKNGGIYWDPYVESSSDASDASSIYQIASGVAGGTELRISQANDSTDVINLVSPYYIYLNSKRAFTIYDSWLRINEDLGFSSGIYTGSSLIRSDNQLQVGSSGSAFYANSSGNGYFSNNLTVRGNLYVSTANTTGNGIFLADDGSIVDNNDGYCSMRFTYGVLITNGKDANTTRLGLRYDGWIYCYNGHNGIYWPNCNGAHVYANDYTSYGAIVLNGSRNGYYGLVVGPGTQYIHLMDNGNDKGLYEQDQRWILYYNRSNGRVSIRDSYSVGWDTTNNGSFYATGTLGSSGLVQSHANGAVASFGAQNSGWVHITNNAGRNWYFDHSVYVDGTLYWYPNSAYYWNGNAGYSATYYTNNWFRTYGNCGWYSESYGGGWYMEDSTWIRAYNSKYVYTPGIIRGDAGMQGRRFESYDGGATYIGHSNNASWVYVQDMASQSGTNYWAIHQTGNAEFAGTITMQTAKVNSGQIYNSGNYWLALQNDNNLVWYNPSGSWLWNARSPTVWNSSRLLKENIQPLTQNDLDKFKQLNIVSYYYKSGMKYVRPGKHFGLIAEEVLQLYPNIVDIPDDYDASKFDISKGICQSVLRLDYIEFVPLLIKMVQNQQHEIEELKNQLIKNSSH